MRLRERRLVAQRGVIQRHRLLQLSLLGKLAGEHRDGHVIFLRDFVRVVKERPGVFPMAQLHGSCRQHRKARRRRECRQSFFVFHQLRRQPHQRHEQADQRQVSVTVRPRLVAHLHQPDDRN